MLNDLATRSLLSIGQLRNEDCIALFSKYHLNFLKNNKVSIEGKRNNSGLWDVPLHHPRTKSQTPTLTTQLPMTDGIIRQSQTNKDLTQYLSASLLGSAKILLRAIQQKQFCILTGTNNTVNKQTLAEIPGYSQGTFRSRI